MDYKSTLNLPKTTFPMKAELPKREPEMLARWQQADLYQQIRKARAGASPFLLHDGPPYANGDIHIGHALNKILKDLIVRYKTMRGFDAPYIPGWDCHGMPIEHQLFKELKITKHQIAQTEFRQKARAYAQKYVDIQREQFKRLGVMGDWEHPYLTMAKDYELTILRVFRELLEAGYIYRGKKPVYWCATCETALAEAEVEYEDRQDASIFVKFPLTETSARKLPGFSGTGAARKLFFVVWTTTPWTLPANVAVAMHPSEGYHYIDVGDEVRIIAKPLALSKPFFKGSLLGSATGRELAGERIEYQQPFSSSPGRVVTDEYVSMEEGTGIVHVAPGHGHEDYVIGQREKLETLSPVDHQGKFTKDVPQFSGQSVFDANPKIIADLKARGLLLKEEPITHSYPHCWRCKQPVIFRATPQWFLSVEHQQLRQRLLEAAKTVTWVPPVGLNRMSGMLETRPDWCLSRQRYWGSPIPILHCVKCDKPLSDPAVIRKIEEVLAAKSVDAWFSLSPKELAPGVTCPTCHGSDFTKETDILDVWFDSGVSYEAVLKARPGLKWPAELYLEGSDQHRGWFQVSLIPSVALHGQPPYRSVLTHGFVMDGEGRKMSKSLGNVVAPQDVMQRYGADILRLWVASCDYREDVRISETILGQVAESYRKVRNTFRYLLANLYDFSPQRDTVSLEQYGDMDLWMLQRTREVLETVTRSYETYQFHEVARAIYQFCVVDLSSFYLDALKDRLYTEAPATAKRRCAQTVLYAILAHLVKLLAPILVATTEEVWQLMREAGWVNEASVHLSAWPQAPAVTADAGRTQRWATFFSMRDVVMKALEEQRSRGVIGSPLEASVTLVINDQRLRQMCETYREALTEAFVVSDINVRMNGTPAAQVAPGVPGLAEVKVARAAGAKCSRCWKYLTSVGANATHPQLCERCARVVTGREQ
ncbi:MAG: isoleucine--tRNA ligase [Candidatus Omnitrophica bacterium]|nr:isoleucine--tRNA ligase [Candidatus Omnitrophota bacterium]